MEIDDDIAQRYFEAASGAQEGLQALGQISRAREMTDVELAFTQALDGLCGMIMALSHHTGLTSPDDPSPILRLVE